MKKKLLICLLLTVICFWHFNVKAEGIADAINEDALASEVISNEEIVGTESETEDESDDESDDDEEGTDEEELVEEKEEDTTDETEKEEETTQEEVTTTDDVEEENNEEGNNEEGNTEVLENESYKVTFLNGEYRLSINGGSSILLSELLNELGINISLSDVENISISNEEVLKIVNNENSNDFVIQSLKSFITIEKLIVKLKDGNEVVIKVVDPDGPAHLKDLIDNEDGTYTLSLDVTGESETKVETAANVNVLIVYDVSSSMTSNYVTTNPNRNRADYAENVVYDFVDSLRQYQNTSDPSNIQVALVTFGPTASGRQTWTSNLTNGSNGINRFFDDGVDGTVTSSHNYGSNNGTNWEHALQRAQEYLRTADSDPTFVILVTDGAPTANGANGSNPGNPSQMNYNQFYTRYGYATDEARAIQTRDNTTLFGIYAYGREADLLDDLIYYSNTGSERSGLSSATDATDNYYNASDTAALNSAIESIFGKIVETLGVGSVNISDGTTSVVAHEASNEVSHLLDVDDESFEYWLTIPVVNNEFKRTDIVSGDEITYHVTDNGNGTTTVTWGSNSVTVDGSVSAGKLKYKWTEANTLYNVAPPEAKVENGAVKWNLESVGTLLNGVTYTVTFDVWPSQDTLDLIADLKNDIVDYDSLDTNVKKYLVKDGDSYTLLTNTETSLTWKDTRPNGYGNGSTTFNEISPVSTSATQTLAVTKEWDNDIDGRKKTPVEIKILKDNKEWYSFELSDDNNWTDTASISVGIITEDEDGNYLVKTSGHDFSFGELGDDVYNWEMKSDIVHPMLINGKLTNLIRYGTDKPEGVKSYKIGSYYYIVGKLEEGVAKLIATNERRSWVDLEKTVNYAENAVHFDDQIFTFDITVGEAGGEDIWFSIMDKATGALIKLADNLGLTVTGATEQTGNSAGYFVATSGSTFTVGIKTGWNVRLLNLLTGTTYTITETNIDSKFEFKDITYLETTDIEGNAYMPTVDKDAYSVSGEIQKTNTKYGYTFINKNVNTEITVIKVWEDNDDVNKNRPSNIVLNLSDGTKIIAQPTKVENEDGTWTYTYTGLAVYDENEELIEYTLTEDAITGYTTKITGDAKEGFTVTNTLETVDVTVNKTWSDNNDQDGLRPTTITLTLSNGDTVELTKDGNWTKTIEGLPKYVDGSEFSYTVTEKNVPTGYQVTYSEDGLTAINTHTPATADVVVTKVWEDSSNKEGLRPGEITIHLLANGTEVKETPSIEKNGDTWTFTYSGLAVNASGSKITYTVTEDKVTNYETEIDGLTITNSREVETTEITIKKIWSDNDNQDGIRSESIEVTLSNGDKVTITKADGWTKKVTGLQKYENGNEIVYTVVKELEVKGYEVSYSNDTLTITNTHTPEKDDVVVTKVWKDSSNKEGLRPEEITVHLFANGTEVKATPEIADNGDDTWTITYSDLDVYANGSKITYTVTEDEVANYKTTIDGLTITNSREVEKVEVNVQKVWEDENNAEGFRPDEVIVNLLANGKVIDTVTLSENNEWEYSWTKLDKYANGSEIEYTVTEDKVDNYETDIEYNEDDDVYIITNTHEVVRTSVTVKKIWVDDNDRDGVRPKKLVITIMKTIDGLSEKVKDIELNDGNKWTETIDNLLKYEDAKAVIYTAEEQDVPKGYEVSYSEDKLTITNTHEIETNDIVVTKVWADDDNESGKRPESVTIILLANDSEYARVELSETNEWTHTFEDVPVNDENHKEIVYSVKEEVVPEGYEVSYEETSDGFIIHNVLGKGDGNPPTGDNILLYLITLLISTIGIISGKLYLKENN